MKMKYTNISMTKTRKYNLGNYETRDITFKIDVELEKDDILNDSFEKLNNTLNNLIMSELQDYIDNETKITVID